jgi:hypothetical protein
MKISNLSLSIANQRRSVYGPELIANGSFDANLTGWIVGADPLQVIPTWTAGGKVTIARGVGGAVGFGQTLTAPVIGQRFLATYDLESGTSSMVISYGSATATGINAGVGSVILTAAAATALFEIWPQSNSATLLLRSISLRRIY